MSTRKKMTLKEHKEHMDSISFSSLVKAIDEKWSHTYVEIPLEIEEETVLKEE